MPTTAKAWIAWSSGKDSVWALHIARQHQQPEVVGLLTTVTETYQRVSMHAVREELLAAQARALGLPLHRVYIPSPCPDQCYEQVMARAMQQAQAEGVTHIVFGDLFLEDIRAYRERQLATVGMQACFPLWGRDTRELAREMIRGGVCAYITCLDPRRVSPELAGHAFNQELLNLLPPEVDPCGENGEFHTFAFAGPGFCQPLAVQVGQTVHRDGFVFTDILLA